MLVELAKLNKQAATKAEERLRLEEEQANTSYTSNTIDSQILKNRRSAKKSHLKKIIYQAAVTDLLQEKDEENRVLLEECNKLRLENDDLNKRLSVFNEEVAKFLNMTPDEGSDFVRISEMLS